MLSSKSGSSDSRGHPAQKKLPEIYQTIVNSARLVGGSILNCMRIILYWSTLVFTDWNLDMEVGNYALHAKDTVFFSVLVARETSDLRDPPANEVFS